VRTERGFVGMCFLGDGFVGLIGIGYFSGYGFGDWLRPGSATVGVFDSRADITFETINKLIRTSRALVQELGREPTNEDIAKRMDLLLWKVRKVLKIAQQAFLV